MALKGKIDIMGIVNLTEDSFFSESRCIGVDAAMEKIGLHLNQGASIVDLGACSTRPGSSPVGEEEEWKRLAPVLCVIRNEYPSLRLSIDTYWASVVRKAYDMIGDFLVNDITSGSADPGMLPLVGELGLEFVAMHGADTTQIHIDPAEEDIITEVTDFFNRFSIKAESFGIKKWVLDPGFGFSKTLEQNWELMRGLSKFSSFETSSGYVPELLVGVSRKSMLYKPLGIKPEESLPATQVLHFAALEKGADILRVHDVKEAIQTVDIHSFLGN